MNKCTENLWEFKLSKEDREVGDLRSEFCVSVSRVFQDPLTQKHHLVPGNPVPLSLGHLVGPVPSGLPLLLTMQ